MKNVLVFFGGTTVEHDVSVITGVMILHAVDNRLFNPVAVYIDHDGKWYTGESLSEIENYKELDKKQLKRVTLINGENKLYQVKGKRLKEICAVYSAINCLHGERGEDGTLFALLSQSNIPLSSPNLTSSAVAIDKDLTKKALKGMGISTVKGYAVTSEEEVVGLKDKLSYPVIVKPCSLGSSIGIESAKNGDELIACSRTAFRYDTKLIIEKKLKNFTEINCSAYRDEKGKLHVSDCERPIGKEDVLTFDDKYVCGSREFPARLDKDTETKIKKITERIYSELNFDGVIRIDFFVKGKAVYVNEINSVPGSLAYYLFCDTLKDFSLILTSLIQASVKKFSAESTLKRQIKTSILNVSGVKSSKRL